MAFDIPFYVVLSYIKGDFVYCPVLLVQFKIQGDIFTTRIMMAVVYRKCIQYLNIGKEELRLTSI